jgi:hypothetical protein
VLGPVFEINFHLTRRLHELGRIDFWSRPLVLALLVAAVGSVVAGMLRWRRDQTKEGA